jgi:hypothetical protein
MKITKQMMGWLGGRARAKALSPAQRKAIARAAVLARWARTSKAQRRKATEPARAGRAKARAKAAKKGAKKGRAS